MRSCSYIQLRSGGKEDKYDQDYPILERIIGVNCLGLPLLDRGYLVLDVGVLAVPSPAGSLSPAVSPVAGWGLMSCQLSCLGFHQTVCVSQQFSFWGCLGSVGKGESILFLHQLIHQLKRKFVIFRSFRLQSKHRTATDSMKQLQLGMPQVNWYFSLMFLSRSRIYCLVCSKMSVRLCVCSPLPLRTWTISFTQNLYSSLLPAGRALASAPGASSKLNFSNYSSSLSWPFLPACCANILRKRCSRQMTALGQEKSSSCGSGLLAMALAYRLIFRLNYGSSKPLCARIVCAMRTWKSFFLILELRKILLAICATAASLLMFLRNQPCVMSRCIDPRETTFLPSNSLLQPTHCQQAQRQPSSLRYSMRGMKMFLGQFFQNSAQLAGSPSGRSGWVGLEADMQAIIIARNINAISNIVIG